MSQIFKVTLHGRVDYYCDKAHAIASNNYSGPDIYAMETRTISGEAAIKQEDKSGRGIKCGYYKCGKVLVEPTAQGS